MPIPSSVPSIVQAGKLYSLTDLINKTIVANKDTKVYFYPVDNDFLYFKEKGQWVKKKNFIYLAPTGTPLGKLYSWVGGKEQIKSGGAYDLKATSSIYLMFEASINGLKKNIYIKLESNTIKTDALTQQGVKTEEQKTEAAAEEQKSTTDKIIESAGKFLKTGLIIGVSAYILVNLGTTFIQTKNRSHA